MSDTIDFYFDFYSPYGYFSSLQIDAIAAKHGRTVNWHPILLGAVFKLTGAKPLLNIPLAGDYSLKDFARLSRRMNVPFQLPQKFPHSALTASRAFYWLDEQDSDLARDYAKSIYKKGFAEGADLTDVEMSLQTAADLGVNRDNLEAAVASQAVKDRLKQEVEKAIEKGVFGSPFFIVDGESFWGNDRLTEVDQWLATGGW